MRRLPDSWRASPQAIDPLSWFTRPLISVFFALTALAYGLFVTVVTWNLGGRPGYELASVLLVVGACLLVQFLTGPLRGPLGPRRAALPMILTLAAVVSSAWAAADSAIAVQHWWAPVGAGIVMGALAAYSTAIEMVAYGVVLTVVTGLAGAAAFADRHVWSGPSSTVIAISSLVVATIATSLFCERVAARSQQLLARAGLPRADQDGEHDSAAQAAEIATLARLGSRVAPFLSGIAEAGIVTDADRALAGQLARRLRTELVSHANRSWLDTLAEGGRIHVVDPDHRADSLTTAQRAAIRGLVLSALADPVTDRGSLFIELRGQADGSTAVALSFDLELPEGRRVMMLAPYYLALKSTVGEISWDPAREMLRFRVPGAGAPGAGAPGAAEE